jgi:hypothetical protein
MTENERRTYRNFYAENFVNQVMRELSAKDEISEEEKIQMAVFAAKMNLAYFSGDFYKIESEIGDSDEWKLWSSKADDIFFASYLKSMRQDSMRNHNIYIDLAEKKG